MGTPLDLLGGGLERLAGWVNQAENGQSGIRERGEGLGQTGPCGVVTILVPPTVLDEVQAILNLPMAANICLEISGRDRVGIQTGHEVPTFARNEFAVGAS